ncbi:hypothetical protein QJS66_11325 [Kocuria rhizophila]|nr:hypothetical protein QJS66_11325 [Kocuria rhizophila]
MERDYVVDTRAARRAGEAEVAVIRTSTGYHSRNGGGRRRRTATCPCSLLDDAPATAGPTTPVQAGRPPPRTSANTRSRTASPHRRRRRLPPRPRLALAPGSRAAPPASGHEIHADGEPGTGRGRRSSAGSCADAGAIRLWGGALSRAASARGSTTDASRGHNLLQSSR